ncbi:translation initiation factor IF-2 [Spirulina sp. CS-785/01]|uniref:translation initiation factor IF-2 n=1 Tax=Spirulina sp. CS-785/01 TaxID=3021716 RepID=UPI00232FE20D|nr:translation initiation factor IF-2 [Spirulina sp. CS-785/01]MDB9313164.1 translation initiation factor IF-2 [Spirulina sp. CS-785/01]
MNNGKIRIYELSKELNLENRDILNLCNQLDIAVKSHSSTITEEQVAQIRSAAQSYQPELEKPKPTPPKGKNANANGGKAGRNQPRKPQIRGIFKSSSKNGDGDTTLVGGVDEEQANTLTPPPKRPVAKEQSSQIGDTSLKHPASRPTEEASPSKPAKPEPPKPQPPEGANPTVAKSEQPSRPTETSAASSSQSESASRPELKSPPPRPKAPAKPALAAKPEPKKPDAKKPEPKKPDAKKSASDLKVKKPKKTTSPSRLQDKEEQDKEEKTPAEAPQLATPKKSKEGKKEGKKDGKKTKSPAKPKLQKPNPPRKPQVVEVVKSGLDSDEEGKPQEEEDNEPTLLEPPERPQPKLKRPSRKRKEWEDDDEETTGKGGKSGKSGKAAKKRKPLIIEDEDELDLALEGEDIAPTAVSLSTARPPKPNQSQPKAKPTSSSKPKKAPQPQQKDRTPEPPRESRERQVSQTPPEKVTLTGNYNIRELADLINLSETDIIKQLFSKGIAVNITQTLDLETAKMVVEELGITVETPEAKSAAAKTEMLDVQDLENLQNRPPVVTIMGHVDHGKTTLLDSIRKTKVAQGEAGGITQHIGAYHVDVEHNGEIQQVVFLDTPGHEAFTAMRARGTKVTDIAILVVAADDGVQPQTIEAISHAKAAEVPLIVAINKVDKPEAEPDRIKQELTEHGLVPEEWGGETIMAPVSAIKGDNLDNLLEMILLVAELEELSANPNRPARGTVIEANLDKSRGPVATLLVQNGTLHVGENIVTGATYGKIRAMIDDRGNRVENASPSFAVEVLGLNNVPSAGDEFLVYATEREARIQSEKNAAEQRENRLQQAMTRRVSLSSISAQAQEGELKELNLVLKADVQGSVEAILGALNQLPQNEVQIRVLLAAPGEVTETDVDLAAASGAVIIGFNTNLAPGSASLADREGVDIREYNIIYNLLEEIRGAMEGLLEPEEVEEQLGTVEVRAVFPVGRGSVAGCYVLSGKVVRNRRMRVIRNGEVVFDGIMDSLKRMKEGVREVSAGYECGIGSTRFNDWQEGDRIEVYQMVMKRRTLSPA